MVMGDNRNNRGCSKENLYHRWMDMKSRCFNPNCCNYSHYGARGISVCDDWLGKDGYMKFKEWSLANGYKKELSLDRINNDLDYCPTNCRWTNKRIQNINRRQLNNTSGYVGIKRHSSGIGWYGTVKVNNKDYYTGYSRNINEAIVMRNQYIIAHNLDNKINEVEYGNNY